MVVNNKTDQLSHSLIPSYTMLKWFTKIHSLLISTDHVRIELRDDIGAGDRIQINWPRNMTPRHF